MLSSLFLSYQLNLFISLPPLIISPQYLINSWRIQQTIKHFRVEVLAQCWIVWSPTIILQTEMYTESPLIQQMFILNYLMAVTKQPILPYANLNSNLLSQTFAEGEKRQQQMHKNSQYIRINTRFNLCKSVSHWCYSYLCNLTRNK